jgi:hypothetical protein
MARLSLHHWLNWTIGSPERGRRWNDSPKRRHTRPHLETLESRCLPSTVTNLNDAGGGSLRDAIAITPSSGTVDFQPGLTGTITLSTGELAINKDLTITGPGATVITVSGNHASRVFDIAPTFTVSISGLTIVDGTSDYGGGIETYGTLTVTGCTISGNLASGSPTAQGGGIDNEGMLTVTGCTITDNVASGNFAEGGGIHSGRTLIVTGSTITGNTATGSVVGGGFGGGIDVDGGGNASIMDCTLSGNSTNGPLLSSGGGINVMGNVSITGSTLSGNSASEGGGINVGSGSNALIVECTLSGNDAGQGGGLYNFAATVTLTGSTVNANSANEGGGIYNQYVSTAPTARNSIVAGNSASLFPGPDVSGPLASLGHNLIGDGTGGSGYDPTDLVGTSSNPIDPRLGPLQDNGGPTFTMALLPGSPAINAGDPTNAPMWDQRGPGYPRVVNGMIDIGAYEHQAAATTITCSVTHSLLWPPNHRLVNVGLGVDVQPPDATVQVQVYAADNANASDAADIAPGTLELRAARQGHGSGRIYLIVVTATSGGQTAFDVCTVVVPHDQSPGSIARVQAEAAAAEAYYREFQTAPPGYNLLGQGSTDAGGNGSASLVASIGDGFRLVSIAFVNPPAVSGQSPTASTIPAADPTGNGRVGGTDAPADSYFALRSEEQRSGAADSWVPELWFSDPVFG